MRTRRFSDPCTQDVLGTIIPAGKQVYEVLNSILSAIEGLGHKAPTMRAITTYLENNNFKIDQGMLWNVSRVVMSDVSEEYHGMLSNATRSAMAELPPEYSNMLANITRYMSP